MDKLYAISMPDLTAPGYHIVDLENMAEVRSCGFSTGEQVFAISIKEEYGYMQCYLANGMVEWLSRYIIFGDLSTTTIFGRGANGYKMYHHTDALSIDELVKYWQHIHFIKLYCIGHEEPAITQFWAHSQLTIEELAVTQYVSLEPDHNLKIRSGNIVMDIQPDITLGSITNEEHQYFIWPHVDMPPGELRDHPKVMQVDSFIPGPLIRHQPVSDQYTSGSNLEEYDIVDPHGNVGVWMNTADGFAKITRFITYRYKLNYILGRGPDGRVESNTCHNLDLVRKQLKYYSMHLRSIVIYIPKIGSRIKQVYKVCNTVRVCDLLEYAKEHCGSAVLPDDVELTIDGTRFWDTHNNGLVNEECVDAGPYYLVPTSITKATVKLGRYLENREIIIEIDWANDTFRSIADVIAAQLSSKTLHEMKVKKQGLSFMTDGDNAIELDRKVCNCAWIALEGISPRKSKIGRGDAYVQYYPDF